MKPMGLKYTYRQYCDLTIKIDLLKMALLGFFFSMFITCGLFVLLPATAKTQVLLISVGVLLIILALIWGNVALRHDVVLLYKRPDKAYVLGDRLFMIRNGKISNILFVDWKVTSTPGCNYAVDVKSRTIFLPLGVNTEYFGAKGAYYD